MRIVNAKWGSAIPIGRLGENKATTVLFDVSKWDVPSGGRFSLFCQRKGDIAPYVQDIGRQGTSISWVVSSVDVSIAGYGKCELVYYVGDVIVKSEMFSTYTEEALTGGAEPPEPWEDWVKRVLQAGEDAQDAKNAAQSAQTGAETAKTAAENAQEAAESARDAAAESSNSAAGNAENAAASAQAASTAQGAAEDAQTASAASAVTAGENATAAENSATAANNAKEVAETAKGEAQTAANTATTQATSAATSAQSAAESAAGAAISASAAAGSAQNAATSESNAYTYQQDAKEYRDETEEMLDDLVKYDNDEFASPLPFNADRLNGHPDSYFAKQEDMSAAEQSIADNRSGILSLQSVTERLGLTKVDKETGKGLSTNDYNNEEKQKVADNRAARHTHVNKSVLDQITQVMLDLIGTIAGKYVKPNGGIPKTDLAESVQTSLGKADSALQQHQSLAAYRTATAQDTLDAQKYSATNPPPYPVTSVNGQTGGVVLNYITYDEEEE